MTPGLQYYDFTLAPGQTRELAADGTYFRYMSGSAGGYDETILVKSDTGAIVCPLKPGQAVRMTKTGSRWYLSNKAGAGTISGVIIVGDGELTDAQVAGSVSVIDGGKARTLANMAYCGGVSIAPVATKYSGVQIWNPIGNTKNIVLESFLLGSSIAGSYCVWPNVTQMATLAGNGFSKRAGQGAGTAQLRYENINATLGTAFMTGYIQGQQSSIINFREPVVIGPGAGLSINHNIVSTADLFASFEFFEEPI